jgi:hypothetical protein
LPNGWHVREESAYPNEPAEHDPEGAGLVVYEDADNYDFVMVYYEKASSSSYTDAQLKAEAESIFSRDQDVAYSQSGVRDFGNTEAGWAKGLDSDGAVWNLEVVIMKDDYYFNAYAGYDATSQSETNVENVLSSITFSANAIGSNTIFGLDMTMFIAIVGVVVAVIVVVVAVVLVKRRKRNSPQMMQDTYAPPPPPPATQ